jgi:SAM-dependent methyltransferase
MKKTILYVNHKAQKCGVYEFGFAIGQVIVQSKKYNIKYCECDSWKEFKRIYKKEKPSAIIYNYHPPTMPWASKQSILKFPQNYLMPIPKIGMIHEVYQEYADTITDFIFDYHLASDPTLLLKNPIVYKTGRLVPNYITENNIQNSKPRIGSFGFGTGKKGFLKIIEKVQQEFDEAEINLNISFAKYGDESGTIAKTISDECAKAVFKKGIQLNITHKHLETQDILSFLSKNDINCFFYDYMEKRGISSSTDWALAVDRPIAITRSTMFRHLFDASPSICIEENSLKNILENKSNSIKKYKEEWGAENLIWDYERILDNVFSRKQKSSFRKITEWVLHKFNIKRKRAPWRDSPWLKTGDSNIFQGFIKDTYEPINLAGSSMNRILNNEARQRYFSTIKFIGDIAPEINKKKIAEANIQQAFVFDTAYRLSKANKSNAQLLSIGAFEDTAAIALKKIGFLIDEIDPVMNYDLGTFITKPNVKAESYDLIISTSVIEHVENDEQFVRDIEYLLKPGGVAIITCDYHNDYKKGDDIPDVDFRFYTQHDLQKRLMNAIPNCSLLDQPDWDCKEYDFNLYHYNYTFASLVFSKNKK